MKSRRKFIVFFMAVVMSVLGLGIDGQSQEGNSGKRALEGSWRVTVSLGPNRPPTTPATVEALATYAAGGGYIFTDSQNAPSAHGSWQFAGHGRFNATQDRFIMNPQGQLVAILHVRSKITLNFTNDEYTTEEEVEIRQFPSGIVLASYTGATSVGRRIRVEPID